MTLTPLLSPLRRPICLGAVALALCACSRRLAVMDDPIGNGGSGGRADTGASGSASVGDAAGSAGTDGSAGLPDPLMGHAPAPGSTNTTPSCNDGIQNGDEAGLDCGGSCAACPIPCDCGNSSALQPLGCELTHSLGSDAYGYPAVPLLNAAGDRVAFSLCDRSGPCQIYYWSLTEGVSALPPVSGGTVLAGMNADANLILSSPSEGIGARALLGAPGETPAPTDMLPSPVLMSANGTVVGISSTTSDSSQLSRRAPNGDLEPLATLPAAANYVELVAVTADASTIVGQIERLAGEQRVFRWTAADGLVVGLSGLPETDTGEKVQALSLDGNVLGGYTVLKNGLLSNLYRWTAVDGFNTVASAAPQASPSTSEYRVTLSDDGSVLGATFAPGNFPYGSVRWTPAGGAVPLAPEASNVFALMSADGSRLIIGADDAKLDSAFLWTQAHGARKLRTLLESAGADFRGWQGGQPVARSADGRVLVGTGTCGGVSTLYRAVLPE